MDEFILNGQAHGPVGAMLMANNWDPSCLRPVLGNDGRTYVTVLAGQDKDGKPIYKARPVFNATATLRKDEWIQLDQVVTKVAKERLRAFADLRAANTYTIGNGMGTTVLQTQNQSDINEADISMDGLRRGDSDRPHYDLTNHPLPIIHKDFSLPLRQIATARQSGSPLDTTMAELAARRCAEKIEAMTVGTLADYTFGGGTVQGYTNYSNRMTKVITSPLAGGWVGETLVTELLQMRKQAYDAHHYGPFMLYFGLAWETYLDRDYSAAKDSITLRDRIARIQNISGIRTLDTLSGYQVIMVQMTGDVARAVVAMEFTTLQWESQGGLEQHFKILGIMVPQLRSDFNGQTGIVHANIA